MARLNQDILPVVREAQRAYGRLGEDPRLSDPRMMRPDESFPAEVDNSDASPYLQDFVEDPELANRGMMNESPLTEADMYQESPVLPEEPGADPVVEPPPEMAQPEPSEPSEPPWRSFARVEDVDEEGNPSGWAYEFDREGLVKIVSAPEGSRAMGVILTSGRAYDAIVDKTAPVFVKNRIRDQNKANKDALVKK